MGFRVEMGLLGKKCELWGATFQLYTVYTHITHHERYLLHERSLDVSGQYP